MARSFVRPVYLLLGTALGGWTSAHLQFGGFPSRSSEELELVLVVLVVASCSSVFVFWPLACAVERYVRLRWQAAALLLACIVASVGLGLWFYAGVLPRSLELALSRDLPYVLAFSTLGLGFAVARLASRHLTNRPSGPPAAAAELNR